MDARTHSWQWLLRNLYFMSCEQIFFCSYSYVVHTEYIISPKEFKSWVTRISFALLSGKTGLSAVKYFVNININVMQLILVNIKWKYVIQKFHDICLSYYFKGKAVLFHAKLKKNQIIFLDMKKNRHFFQIPSKIIR
jgi:5'(3')-deoxyribonucleotidase